MSEEVHIYGDWRDRAAGLEPSPEGLEAINFLRGDNSPLSPEAAQVVRELFATQDRARTQLQATLARGVAELRDRAQQNIEKLEEPVRLHEAAKAERAGGLYTGYMEAAQILVDAINAAGSDRAG